MIFLKDHKDKNGQNRHEPIRMDEGDGFLRGKLLVATPLIQDSCFVKSVVLICDHSATGGMGLIINKYLRNIDQQDLFTKLNLEKPADSGVNLEVYFGGPVDTNRGFVIHSDEYKTKNTIKIATGVAVTSEQQVLRDYLNGKGPKNLALIMGYAGWVGGQLESEVEQNSWLAFPADAELVFSTHDDSKWQKVGSKYGINVNDINPISGTA